MAQSTDLSHSHSSNVMTNVNLLTVGIVGGGTAGSTIAIRLAELGVQVHLFERKPSLISGPPMCHLHAGGNLYREIPDEDCLALLEQCVDILRLYPHTVDVRPTVFAVPTRDEGTPEDLLPRLDKLVAKYRELIANDPANKVIGEPEDYYRLYDRADVERLANSPQVAEPQTPDEWMIPIAKKLNLDKVKFPLILVNEYGWNIFRMSASATLALNDLPNAHVHTDTLVKQVTPITDGNEVQSWQINYQRNEYDGKPEQINVDFLINASGFRTGVIDDMAGVDVTRMVEFKASYVTHWSPEKMGGLMPELIIHGTRGTPHGMVQLTPYPDGNFQIHSMNHEVTLFPDGLAKLEQDGDKPSSQPRLKDDYRRYIDSDWTGEDDQPILDARSQKAIEQVAEFVPSFASATVVGKALYGGQQIPGEDDTLRVADMSVYKDKRYARAENVKASSALQASDVVVDALAEIGLLAVSSDAERDEHRWDYLAKYNVSDIDRVAYSTATARQFPTAMGGVNRDFIS